MMLVCIPLTARVSVSSQRKTATDYEFSRHGVAMNVIVDGNDYLPVCKAAQLFADNLGRVTDTHGIISAKVSDKKVGTVIVGTIHHSEWIDRLVKAGKIDIRSIEGDWERYVVTIVNKVGHGVGRAVVVAGSDKRGAAYGILALSEAMGVSPLYWWSDVPVQHREALFLSAGITVSKTPSVRYRGIFINDEDWGITPWARNNFEKSLGDIGPKTYAKVCELLLRMKANMLAPAMHPCSGAFYIIRKVKLLLTALEFSSPHRTVSLCSTTTPRNGR